MMNKLSRADLFSLEQYAEARPEFRRKVLEHKKNRRLEGLQSADSRWHQLESDVHGRVP